jgi:hypothetical protein
VKRPANNERPRYASPVCDDDIRRRQDIVINKATIFTIETWITLAMAVFSASFPIYDLIEHGILFPGSLLSLALAIAFGLLNRRAEGRINKHYR